MKITIGKTLGRLTVLQAIKKNGRTHFRCECSCGTIKVIYGSSLRSGATRSCGCLMTEARKTNHLVHGGYTEHRRTFNSWRAMIARCYDEKSEKFPTYGGRGIIVCDRWHDFKNFLADMGRRPIGKTLHRKENDGNYSAANCEWADLTTQANNTRTNHRITAFGQTKTLTQWARQRGLKHWTIARRLGRGMTPERALT